MTTFQHFTQIRDRNEISFHISNGFQCTFVPRADGGLNGEFELTTEFEKSILAWHTNAPTVRIHDFLNAARMVSNEIHNYLQQDSLCCTVIISAGHATKVTNPRG